MGKWRKVNGLTYMQIRTGGWRLVKDGYIRTRRGWRKLRRRPKSIAVTVNHRPARDRDDPIEIGTDVASRRIWVRKYANLKVENVQHAHPGVFGTGDGSE